MSRSFTLNIAEDNGRKSSAQNDPDTVPNEDLKTTKKGFSLKLPNFLRKKKKGVDQQDLDLAKNVKITQHLLTLDQLATEFKTDLKNGLTESEAAVRLARDGPNAFTPPRQTPGWVKFMREMTTGFALLLWFASLASFVSYGLEKSEQDLYLGVILALVVIVTGTFSYYQQASSSSVFDSFKDMIPPQTYVVREGKKRLIEAKGIVIGDLVYCKGGDRIPADIRVISCEGMKVDNSSLTGESDALSRSPDAGHHMPLEAKNLAFFSTNCVDGNGFGIVIATGDNTVMGNIAKLVSNIKNEKTPIAIEISRFVKIITVIAVGSGVIFFGIAMGFGSSFFQAFIFMIGITVGNVPEGLLPALAVALTITAKQMAAKSCLVKNLESVETLGSTTTICTDKTGTLTQNRMTVEHCYLAEDIFKVSHERSEIEERMQPVLECWEAFSRCCTLCSRAEFAEDSDVTDIMKRPASGDATETAILRFMESVGKEPVIEYRRKFPKVAEKPFSSTYKYQFSIHKNPPQSEANFFLVMKGAPERIVKMCTKYMSNEGETVGIDHHFMKEFEETYRELGSKGERVIALCDREFTEFAANHTFDLDKQTDFEMENFRFLGLISMIDPPRPSVPEAVRKCRSAGIKVIMVTGDHPITAQAIAKSVSIFTHSHRRSTRISMPTIDFQKRGNSASIVIPGEELLEMDDEQLRETLRDYNEIVFARTSPQQKLRIVENCQYLGQIVAVTGDGVNDSPALKKANIGIAMGITGSDVSKQAADMILLDDNFATIVIGVEEGRRIFDNMKKTVMYIMAGSVTTLYPFVIYVIFGFPLAIGTITVLLICLGTDMLPAISLAYEKAESDIMSLKPRNPRTDNLVTNQLLYRSYLQIGAIETAAGFFAYFMSLWYNGFAPQDLWQCRPNWENTAINDYKDSYGGIHTYDDRMLIQLEGQSSYFVAVVVSQWIDVIISKTRRLSLFQHGLFENKMLIFGLFFETAITVLCCYTPTLNDILSLRPVKPMVWLSAVPFFFYIFAYDELRKYIIRRFPDSFLAKELIS